MYSSAEHFLLPKKQLSRILVFTMMAFLFASCRKEESSHDFYMRYTNNGKQRLVNKFTATVLTNGVGSFVQFNCTDNQLANESMIFVLDLNIPSAHYQLPNFTTNNNITIESAGEYYQPHEQACSFSISEHDQELRTMTGTFEGIFYKSGQIEIDSLIIENGKFKIGY